MFVINIERKIIFRAKEIETFDWIYGDLLRKPTNNGVVYFIVTYDMDNVPIMNAVVPETVGQFTGLYDKNNNMIFEGDVVKKRTYNGIEDCIVRFDGGMFHCGYGGGSSTPNHRYTLEDKRIEVIGNVYKDR